MGTTTEPARRNRRHWPWLWSLALCVSAHGQACQGPGDMDAPVRTALEASAKRYFEMSARGDVAGLKQNSIPAVAASFTGIESAVKENQTAFAGAKTTVRPPFLLTVEGVEPIARAEFLCGIFGRSGQTKDSAVFVLNNLPPGRYGVTIIDVTNIDVTNIDVSGDKGARTLTLVLQQAGADWKLAGFYARSAQAAGHDAAWFAQRARDFKNKAQHHNAWLYYREAIALAAPVDFMSTEATDKLYEESQATQPADVPVNGPVDLSAGGKVYHLTEIFPLAVGDELEVVVKYRAADVSDTARTFQENTAVIKALVSKFPEFRQAFAGVIARAVEPSGRDYGTLLAMKDIK